MQFFVYDPNWDPNIPAAPPTPAMMEEMGKFIGEAMQAGKIVIYHNPRCRTSRNVVAPSARPDKRPRSSSI